jgi:hypothetical protein
MKRKWLMLALTLCFFLPNLTENHLATAQAPSSSCYSDSGSSITWTVTEPRNQTYNTPNLNLSVTGETCMATLTNISYSIDGKQRVFLHMTYEKTADDPITQVRRGYAQLPPLSDGVHKITVYIDGWAGFPSKTIPTQKTVINVGINTATPVQHNYIQGNGARLYSPLNQSYQPDKAILIKASSPSLGGANIIYSGTYTIDDGNPLKLKTEPQLSSDSFFGGLIGTCVLPSGSLSEGQHKLTVYLKTYIETTAKPPTMSGEATVYFTIGNPKNPSSNQPENKTAQETSAPTHGKDITVWSPTNRTYKTGETIKLEATSKNLDYHLHGASYKLDDTLYTLDNKENQSQEWDPAFGTLFGCVTLPKLSEGSHKLTVHLQIVYPAEAFVDEVTVYFSVANNSPNITLHSIDGTVFNQSNIPLNFTVNKPASWMAYCLDNGTQTTIVGNTTLTVAPGNHTITVYANDTAGNLGQSTACFTVQVQNTATGLDTDETVILATITTVVIALVVAAVLIFSKGKRNRGVAL